MRDDQRIHFRARFDISGNHGNLIVIRSIVFSLKDGQPFGIGMLKQLFTFASAETTFFNGFAKSPYSTVKVMVLDSGDSILCTFGGCTSAEATRSVKSPGPFFLTLELLDISIELSVNTLKGNTEC